MSLEEGLKCRFKRIPAQERRRKPAPCLAHWGHAKAVSHVGNEITVGEEEGMGR